MIEESGRSLLNVLNVLIVGREVELGAVGQESDVAFLREVTSGCEHDEYLLSVVTVPPKLASMLSRSKIRYGSCSRL